MTPWILGALGAVVLALLAADLFVTALTLRGNGSLTRWVAQRIWRLGGHLHRRRTNHAALRFAGPAIVVLVLALWIALLWLGWALIFIAAGEAIVDSSTGEPADLWSRIYFAGFNVFTLGLGDYRPVGAAWQMLTALSASSGLLGITLAITYFVPVLSTAVRRQAAAAQIALLGGSPEKIVAAARREGLEAFGQRVSRLTPDLLQLSRQHLAYPILHYFHAADPRFSLPLRLAALYEGLRLLERTAPSEERLPGTLSETLVAIGLFLEMVEGQIAGSASQTPPPHDLELGLGEDQSRQPDRRLLLALVRHDGWDWAHVHEDPAQDRTSSPGPG